MWCCHVGGAATTRRPAAQATELQRTRTHDSYLTDIERSICGVWRVCRRQHCRLPPEFRQELRERRRPNAADAADRRKVVRDDQDPPHGDSGPAWRANTFCCKRAILGTDGLNHRRRVLVYASRLAHSCVASPESQARVIFLLRRYLALPTD